MNRNLTGPVLFMVIYSGAVIATPLVLATGIGMVGTVLLLLCVAAGLVALVPAHLRKQRVMPVFAIPFGALAGSSVAWILGLVIISLNDPCGYYPLGHPLFFVALVGGVFGYKFGAGIGLFWYMRSYRSKTLAGDSDDLWSFAVPIFAFLIVLGLEARAASLVPGVLANLGLSLC